MRENRTREISRKTFLYLLLILIAVASFSLGFGINAGKRQSVSADVSTAYSKQWEWSSNEGQTYDTAGQRTVTVRPGEETAVSGLYLLNPDGTVMPSQNNHLHLQVNFTYSPLNDAGVPINAHTYKYSLPYEDTANGAHQSLGNNGAGETTSLVYPRDSGNNYLFKIDYVSQGVTFDLKLTFNSMTPTGAGTFDIRYFAHPGASSACDYSSAYKAPTTADYTDLDAVVKKSYDTYHYFNQYYNNATYKKQVLKVKVEKESTAAGGGLPELNVTNGYDDLGDNYFTPSMDSKLITPVALLKSDFNLGFDTYGFVKGSHQVYINDADHPGYKKKINLEDYFDCVYQSYITDLLASKVSGNVSDKTGSVIPVPSTYVPGTSTNAIGADGNVKKESDGSLSVARNLTTFPSYPTTTSTPYFSTAYGLKLTPKADKIKDLYGHTLYFTMTIERAGSTQPMQVQSQFQFSIKDSLIQLEDSYSTVTPPEFKVDAKQSLALNLSQVVDLTGFAGRYHLESFVGFCPNDNNSEGCGGETPNSGVNGPNPEDAFTVGTPSVANDILTLTRKDTSSYVGNVYMILRIEDVRDVNPATKYHKICVRVELVAEGIDVLDYDSMRTAMQGLTAEPGSTVTGVLPNFARTNFTNNNGGIDSVQLNLHNYLAKYIQLDPSDANYFDILDSSNYTVDSKLGYGIKLTADKLYTPVSNAGNGHAEFRLPGGSGMTPGKPVLIDTNGTFFVWVYMEYYLDGVDWKPADASHPGTKSEICIFPYRNTMSKYYPMAASLKADTGLAFDVVLVVDADVNKNTIASAGSAARKAEFRVQVDNSTISQNSIQNIREYAHGSFSSQFKTNYLNLVVSNSGYNKYKSGTANANQYDLKNSFVVDAYNWVRDIDAYVTLSNGNYVPSTAYPYDKLSFKTVLGAELSLPNGVYVTVQFLKAGGNLETEADWIAAESYSSATYGNPRYMRFTAVKSTQAAYPNSGVPATFTVQDSAGTTYRATIMIAVEDSRPVYYQSGNPTPDSSKMISNITTDNTWNSRSGLYFGEVTYNPLLLRSDAINSGAVSGKQFFLNSTNKNGNNQEFTSQLKDVTNTVTYNINDMLMDPDSPLTSDRPLGFAVDGNTDVINFWIHPATLTVDTVNVVIGGAWTAVRSGNTYKATVTAQIGTQNNVPILEVTFSNNAISRGSVTLKALQGGFKQALQLEFNVSEGGNAIVDNTSANWDNGKYLTSVYSMDVYLLSSLPQAPSVIEKNVSKHASTADAIIVDMSKLIDDRYLSGDDTVDKEAKSFYSLPTGYSYASTNYGFIQYWNYTANGGAGAWTNIGTDTGAVWTAPADGVSGNAFELSYQYSSRELSIYLKNNNTNSQPIKIRFYVTNFKIDGNKDAAVFYGLTGELTDFATKVELWYTLKENGLSLDSAVSVDGASNVNWNPAGKAGFYSVYLKNCDFSSTDADGNAVNINKDHITFACNEKAYLDNIVLNDEMKKYLNFTSGTPKLAYLKYNDGTGKYDVAAGDADFDIAFVYKRGESQLWLKPQNRTLPSVPLRFTLKLRVNEGGPMDNTDSASAVSFQLNIPNADFTITHTSAAYENGQHEGNFYVGSAGVNVSVGKLTGATGENTGVETTMPTENTAGTIVMKAKGSRKVNSVDILTSYYPDLNDGYYLAVPANRAEFIFAPVGTAIHVCPTCGEVADGAACSNPAHTAPLTAYYPAINVTPVAKPAGPVSVEFSVLDIFGTGLNRIAGVTTQRFSVSFEVASAMIDTIGREGMLDLTGKTVFTGETAVGGCPNKGQTVDHCAPVANTFVFCDGENHYLDTKYTTENDANWSKTYLSQVFSNKDLTFKTNAGVATKAFADLTNYKLKLDCFEAEIQNGKYVPKGDALNGYSTNYTEINTAGSVDTVLSNSWFRFIVKNDGTDPTVDQTIQLALLSRKGMEAFQYGIIIRLYFAKMDGSTVVRGNYFDIRLKTEDNRPIVAKSAFNNVLLAMAADGYEKTIKASEYVFDYNGDEVRFAASGAQFSDYYTASVNCPGLYSPAPPTGAQYVTLSRPNGTDSVTGKITSDVKVKLNKLHQESWHPHVYTVTIPVEEKVPGTDRYNTENLEVTFRYISKPGDTSLNTNFGTIDGKTLKYSGEVGDLYSMATGGKFTLYASQDYYMANPKDGQVLDTSGAPRYSALSSAQQKWIVGADKDINDVLRDSLTFSNPQLSVMYKNPDGTVANTKPAGAIDQGNAELYASLLANNGVEVGTGTLPTFDPNQVYAYTVQAKKKLTEPTAFLRLRLTSTDTSGNPVTYNDATNRYVYIDFTTADSAIDYNKNRADGIYQGDNRYLVQLQSARAAWGDAMPRDGVEPAAQEFALNKLIADGDYNDYSEKFTVSIDGANITASDLYEKRDAQGNLLFKVGYRELGTTRMLMFYSYRKTVDEGGVTIPNLVITAAGKSVSFNTEDGLRLTATVADSLPMRNLNADESTFKLNLNSTTKMPLDRIMYDYDGDLVTRNDALGNPMEIEIKAVNMGTENQGHILTKEEMAKYFTVDQKYAAGLSIKCNDLMKIWDTKTVNDLKTNIVVTATLKVRTSVSGEPELIVLTGEYENTNPLQFKTTLPNNYRMSLNGSDMEIYYTGSDAEYDATINHNLVDFFNLNSFFTIGASNYINLKLAGADWKQYKKTADGNKFCSMLVNIREVGDNSYVEMSFSIRDSAGNYPTYNGTAVKGMIRIYVKVANTAPELLEEWKETTGDKVLSEALAPGDSIEISPDMFAGDVNNDVLNFMVDSVTNDDGTIGYKEDISLGGKDGNGAYVVKHVSVGGNYPGEKILIQIKAQDKDGNDVTGGKLTIPELMISDGNGGSLKVTNITVNVVLAPMNALEKGKDTTNKLVAYRSVPMYFDVAAKDAAAGKASMKLGSGTVALAAAAGDYDFDKDYKYTTLVNPKELFGTYADFITAVSVKPGEGYTVDEQSKKVTITSTEASVQIPIKFMSGKQEQEITITVAVAEPLPIDEEHGFSGLPALDVTKYAAGSTARFDIASLVKDVHGRKLTVENVQSNDDLICVAGLEGETTIVLTPKSTGTVYISFTLRAGDQSYDMQQTVKLTGYPAVSWWTKLMQNPLILWIAGAALVVVVLIVILVVAKHGRKKRMMKELETMLLAEMEADEQLKLSDNNSMMNMGTFNPYQLNAGFNPPGYDPNMLNLGPGMGSQNQFGGQSQFNQPNQFGGQSQFNQPNQFGGQSQFNQPNQFGGQSQFNQPNQFGGQSQFSQPNQFGGQSQYGNPSQFGNQNSFGQSQNQFNGQYQDPNQFGQYNDPNQFQGGNSQYGADYIDLDDFNNRNNR